jgi:hypothetical protein
MSDADLLTIADREMQRLDAENDHSAAAIMRALMDRVRASLPVTIEVPPEQRTMKLADGTIVPVRG